MNKCNDCEHKSKVGIYNFQTCIRCEHNPFVIADRFKAIKTIIVPQNAGELWRHKATKGYFHTDHSTQDSELCLIGYNGRSRDADITHNENWERIFPYVEDET